MRTTKDTQTILEKDNKKVFQHIFESEFEDGDWEKNKQFLQNNIDALNHYLNKMDIDNALKGKEKELINDYNIKKEALDNFDKYFSDLIIDMKGKKDMMKAQFHSAVSSFEEQKTKELEKMKIALEQEKNNFEQQLEDEIEKIKIYN